MLRKRLKKLLRFAARGMHALMRLLVRSAVAEAGALDWTMALWLQVPSL